MKTKFLIFTFLTLFILSGFLISKLIEKPILVDKWIERKSSLQVLSPMVISGKEHLTKRTIVDGQDYVFIIRYHGTNFLAYTDSTNWFACRVGEPVSLKRLSLQDKTYRRAIVKYRIQAYSFGRPQDTLTVKLFTKTIDSMEQFEVKGKPAVKIFARKIKELDKAVLFDCEGDRLWLPKSGIRIVDEQTILVQEWLYREKFEYQ